MAGRRAGIQLCYPLEEKRLTKWGFPHELPGIYVQPKLDGERCRVDHYDGGMFLLSSEENPFFFLDHIEHAIHEYFPRIELDGELYVHGWSFEKIHSVVSRKKNPHEETSRVEYHVFDFCGEELAQASRVRLLREVFQSVPPDCPVKLVQTHICRTVQDLYDLYDSYRVDGYEGIVVRNPAAVYRRTRSTDVMKFKPKKTDIYIIHSFVEAVSISGEPLDMVGAIWCIDDDGNKFKVGAGHLTHEQRKAIWADRKNFIGRAITVGYQATTERGVPRFGLTFDIA